jgi:hypothetical protein
MDETARFPVVGCQNGFGFEHRPHVCTACCTGSLFARLRLVQRGDLALL